MMKTDMKIMRSNYDKAHRCPGWAGPALKGIEPSICASGSFAKEFHIQQYWYNKDPYWRFHKCRTCGTVVLPSNFRKFDPVWWKFAAQRKWDNWKYERELDKRNKNNLE
jgi:hypothetical protein